MVNEQKTTEETLSELKEDIKGAKRRIKFSKDFEKEVRTIISRLYIIDAREKSLSSFKNYFPERLPVDLYKKLGKEYFSDSSFIPDDYTNGDIEEFEKFLYNNLNDLLEICEQVVNDALYELERFDKAQKPTVKTKITKPKVIPKKEEKLKPRDESVKPRETSPVGKMKIPLPFIELEIPITTRELLFFIFGIFIGFVIIIGFLLGYNLFFG